MEKTVLHITTHMGGGVGKVLAGIAAYAGRHGVGYKHKIILLEQPEKLNFVEICQKNGVEIKTYSEYEEIKKAMKYADIVQVEWWHHPLMCKFLAAFPQVPIRLVVWSHISGCYYPWIPDEFLQIPHKFIFTSRYSYDNPYWQENTQKWAHKNCGMINSSGGFDNIKTAERSDNDDFCVGYMGTMAFSKLHPDFMKYCAAVSDISSIIFRMVGDKDNAGIIMKQAGSANIAEKFQFSGYVNDVSSEFSQMDVFGYILNPEHFGTTENVLLEAMAAGLPVVCLRQCAEKYLVEHNRTGLLVSSVEEYREAITYLHSHPAERRRLGDNARRYVNEHVSVENTVTELNHVYEEALLRKKECFTFNTVLGREGAEFLKRCLPPPLRAVFPGIKNWPPILLETSKSSIRHFGRVFPEDINIQAWCDLLP